MTRKDFPDFGQRVTFLHREKEFSIDNIDTGTEPRLNWAGRPFMNIIFIKQSGFLCRNQMFQKQHITVIKFNQCTFQSIEKLF